MIRAMLVSVLLLSGAHEARAQAPAALEAALARSGDNRVELERALAAVPAAQRAQLAFLLEHMPVADAKSLTAGFLLREVDAACQARARVAWGAELDEDMFRNYVLPYAQADERREDWRTGLAAQWLDVVGDCATPGEAAQRLNAAVFDAAGVHYSTERRAALQSPSESIAQGKASCTGLSILLADACRACCVPARLVSVRWPHKRGNHTWVEVWDGVDWRFCGADEPDPQGLDRAWFTGDATQCADADREHRIWALSFAPTGERCQAGWGRRSEHWGIDVSARYAAAAQDPQRDADAALAAQLDRFFAADGAAQAKFAFDRNLDAELRTEAGDARLRRLAFEAYKRAERERLAADHDARRVRAGDKESPFTIKEVGNKPGTGWALVIAMHGGGGVPKRVNDSQWEHMQVYYKDHPEVGGYLYCALRAPTDEWNGFYTDYFYPLIEQLIRQCVVCADVDPDRVIALGYSHGGYGAFAVGPKLPHRFAAVHASAAAPTAGQSLPTGLHTLPFSFMVGDRDTAYGRRARCEEFAQLLGELKQSFLGRYPTKFTLVEDNGHTGLPDRDLLAELLPHVRVALPNAVFWEPSDGVVRDHYWLRVPEPKRGQRIEAVVDRNSVRMRLAGVTALEVWLDARLCDLTQPIDVITGGGEPLHVEPQPTLRTLCATMQDRGDPVLAASVIVEVDVR